METRARGEIGILLKLTKKRVNSKLFFLFIPQFLTQKKHLWGGNTVTSMGFSSRWVTCHMFEGVRPGVMEDVTWNHGTALCSLMFQHGWKVLKPYGKLTWQWKIHHLDGIYQAKCGYSIAMLVYQRVCSIGILICIFFIHGPLSNHDSFHVNGHSVPFNTYGRPCRQGNFHHLPSTQNCCDANTPCKKGAFLKHQPSGGLTCNYTCVFFFNPPLFVSGEKKS